MPQGGQYILQAEKAKAEKNLWKSIPPSSSHSSWRSALPQPVRFRVRGGDRQLRRLRLHPRQPQLHLGRHRGGGDPPATAMRVTVPHRAPDGHVAGRRRDHRQQLPDRQPLLRRSAREVRFHHRSLRLEAHGPSGNKSILAGEKVDSNKLGFAISIGGGRQKATGLQRQHPDTHRRAHRRLLHDRRG